MAVEHAHHLQRMLQAGCARWWRCKRRCRVSSAVALSARVGRVGQHVRRRCHALAQIRRHVVAVERRACAEGRLEQCDELRPRPRRRRGARRRPAARRPTRSCACCSASPSTSSVLSDAGPCTGTACGFERLVEHRDGATAALHEHEEHAVERLERTRPVARPGRRSCADVAHHPGTPRRHERRTLERGQDLPEHRRRLDGTAIVVALPRRRHRGVGCAGGWRS